MKTVKWIVVDDGFEGTFEQWSDCFFKKPTEESIREYCKGQGWKVEFGERKIKDNVNPHAVTLEDVE